MRISTTALELRAGDRLRVFLPSVSSEEFYVTIKSSGLSYTSDDLICDVITTTDHVFKMSPSQHCVVERD